MLPTINHPVSLGQVGKLILSHSTTTQETRMSDLEDTKIGNLGQGRKTSGGIKLFPFAYKSRPNKNTYVYNDGKAARTITNPTQYTDEYQCNGFNREKRTMSYTSYYKSDFIKSNNIQISMLYDPNNNNNGGAIVTMIDILDASNALIKRYINITSSVSGTSKLYSPTTNEDITVTTTTTYKLQWHVLSWDGTTATYSSPITLTHDYDQTSTTSYSTWVVIEVNSRQCGYVGLWYWPTYSRGEIINTPPKSGVANTTPNQVFYKEWIPNVTQEGNGLIQHFANTLASTINCAFTHVKISPYTSVRVHVDTSDYWYYTEPISQYHTTAPDIKSIFVTNKTDQEIIKPFVVSVWNGFEYVTKPVYCTKFWLFALVPMPLNAPQIWPSYDYFYHTV